MYLWRRLAARKWLSVWEEILRSKFGGRLAVIERPGRKRAQLEVACAFGGQARELVQKFGGRIEKLPRDWLKRFARAQKSNPLRIGKRLVVSDMPETSLSRRARPAGLSRLIIPAG